MAGSKKLDYLDLRAKYGRFIYHDYEISIDNDYLNLQFVFSIEGLSYFRPSLRFPLANKERVISLEHPVFKRLCFCLGMIELISYWKLTASPELVIECSRLNDEEIKFFKTVYFNGLGEYFYLNNMKLSYDDFMNIRAKKREAVSFLKSLGCTCCTHLPDPIEKVILPVGGGKDSLLSMAILEKAGINYQAFALNPNKTIESCFAFSPKKPIRVSRSLDSELLNLNAKGFLNGHTPFSALLAFVSLVTAYISSSKWIVLSNELSANEASVVNSSDDAFLNVNHQWSKSSEFESIFQKFVSEQLGLKQEYFSLLRPFYEINIAKNFVDEDKFLPVFRSCNRGSKENKWCEACPKCLFVALICLPFLLARGVKIAWMEKILDNKDLENDLIDLLGLGSTKPFECVGAVIETRLAMQKLKKYYEGDEPYLVSLYARYAEKYALDVDFDAERRLFSLDLAYFVKLPKLFQDAINSYLQAKLDLQNGTQNGSQYDEQIKFLLEKFAKQKLAIWGLGIEGLSSIKLISYALKNKLLNLEELKLYDKNDKIGLLSTLPNDILPLVKLETGGQEMRAKIYEENDHVIKAPGIPLLEATPIEKQKTTCQINEFLKLFSRKSLGVTGSKGKSTTTSILAALLNTKPLGNIGEAVFDVFLSQEQSHNEKPFVLELSSHQLEFTFNSPHIAIITNLYEEHLDHYDSLEAYYEAKFNIARYQSEEDYLIFVADEKELFSRVMAKKTGGEIKSKLIGLSFDKKSHAENFADKSYLKVKIIKNDDSSVTISLQGLEFNFKNLPFSLQGSHHAYDIGMALIASLLANYGKTVFSGELDKLEGDILAKIHSYQNILQNFKGLPHRLEYCGTFQRRIFYNDSIATIPRSSVLAMQTLKKVDILLCGGMDRGLDYRDYASYLDNSELRFIILMPDTGAKIAGLLQKKPYFLVANMEEAFIILKQHSEAEDLILLSPAASSYNLYPNFAARGEEFKNLITKYFS